MKPITSSQAQRVAQLVDTLGEKTLRQLLTAENKRLLRPERLRNLTGGTARLSEQEAAQLKKISANSNQLKNLKARGKRKREYETNRALRDWLNHGKEKDGESESDLDRLQAIRSLGFFGVDPTDGTFYIRRST